MNEERIKLVAMVTALVAHLGLAGFVWGASRFDHARLTARADATADKYEHIQAGLAVRSKSAKGRKTKQPQKDTQRKVAPGDVAVSRDDQKKDDEKKDEKDPDAELDPESVFNKHRDGAEGKPTDDPAAEAPGGDEETKAGRADGSEFGTLADAQGDPYAGELAGRMSTNPDLEVPSTVPEGTGLETWGCVRLSADGKVADVELDPKHKSDNAAFNSAVLRRVKLTTNMESAVPPNMISQLVEEYLCVPFRY